MKRRPVFFSLLAALLCGPHAVAKAQVVFVPQGAAWTAEARTAFYIGDQGSQMIPLAWMRALHQKDGKPFLADALSRYGYLPNTVPGNPPDIPVGFTVAATATGPTLGMTCSACHTREITAGGKSYRIDGGPAIVDFQSLLADLDQAVLAVLDTNQSFDSFAQTVLGSKTPDPAKVAVLRADVTVWSARYHVLMSKALPKVGWGPSRLDAVSMIFDRLTGLDIGQPPTYLIPENILEADAPTRYPFLWNSPLQSQTQWPGFADNGSDLYGLSRNLGEVYGVFGTFHPRPADHFWDAINRRYNKENSANYGGLLTLEKLVRKIGAPTWPWAYDAKMAERGKAIFNRAAPQGCVECHGQTPGPTRFGIDPLLNATWATPVQDVGTDTHESDILGRPADSGSLAGASIPGLAPALCQKDYAFNILATSVLGGIIQYYAPLLQAVAPPEAGRLRGTGAAMASAQIGDAELQASGPQFDSGTDLKLTRLNVTQFAALRSAFLKAASQPACSPPATAHNYESRVLYGIWAAAPYLHNGSVPTLAELLKPSALRVKSFKVGPAYDTTNVGLAVAQTKFDYTLVTTGCDHLSSGSSNCGHEYGTTLSDAEKTDLIEYLKVIKPGE